MIFGFFLMFINGIFRFLILIHIISCFQFLHQPLHPHIPRAKPFCRFPIFIHKRLVILDMFQHIQNQSLSRNILSEFDDRIVADEIHQLLRCMPHHDHPGKHALPVTLRQSLDVATHFRLRHAARQSNRHLGIPHCLIQLLIGINKLAILLRTNMI